MSEVENPNRGSAMTGMGVENGAPRYYQTPMMARSTVTMKTARLGARSFMMPPPEA
jgi:hypothetical protein